ncbi:cell surface glycoprotein CD200 receptor 1-A-like [Myxocyprinus asiaticus]|uniref:cell surface glycoprotein CD200 receptor 1-A-like n=1 Tax=Myxocyprinus asiaticus TaxID=70543 RepID=UPI002222D904|nr:cell surface glycoprotein CD200 receptor 1-A-like [Myxocyprinus asiaticus]
MTNNRTLTVVALLSLFVARHHTRGEDQNINLTQPLQARNDKLESKLTVFKAETFMEGRNVNLTCGNSEVKWNELIYITWNISLKSRKCFIGMVPSKLESICNDGKMHLIHSNGVSLFIPNISKEDEGFYSCDISYREGTYAQTVKVSVIVPNLVSRQEFKNGQWYVICEAKYEQSAPTLHWEPALQNVSNTSIINKGDVPFVENRVYLHDVVNVSNLTCVANYPNWQQNTTPDLIKPDLSDHRIPWEIISIAVGSVCFITVFLAVVYVLCRKLNSLSVLKMLCCKSKISTLVKDKPIQPHDVEEVEPYASYIQRVNSIYNSSAELFNA